MSLEVHLLLLIALQLLLLLPMCRSIAMEELLMELVLWSGMATCWLAVLLRILMACSN